jgi:dTDP-glucose 4,6-dehydratase
MKVLVTGGCGFIGTNLVLRLLEEKSIEKVLVVDKLTYASNDTVKKVMSDDNWRPKGYEKLFFKEDDIINISSYKPDFDFCIHLAAESHVDKSLHELDNFIHTNVKDTYEVAKWCFKNDIKLIHFSTDEVYGHLALGDEDRFQEEQYPKPRNPYAVSKLFAEQMIDLANIEYHKKGKYLILRPSNNFGEYQDKTKFIPVILNSIMNKKKIPVYGEGKNEREWLYVGDTVDIVTQLLTEEHSSIGFFKYLNLGSGVDLSNVELIKNICELLDTDANEHIEFVEDPRGNMHDLKYAVDSFKLSCIYDTNKIKSKFKENLRNTVWFLTHNH